jgi:hypothetical protein
MRENKRKVLRNKVHPDERSAQFSAKMFIESMLLLFRQQGQKDQE